MAIAELAFSLGGELCKADTRSIDLDVDQRDRRKKYRHVPVAGIFVASAQVGNVK